jgi:hypothetical protein
MTLPHEGHLAFFPAAEAGALSFFPHGQTTVMVSVETGGIKNLRLVKLLNSAQYERIPENPDRVGEE